MVEREPQRQPDRFSSVATSSIGPFSDRQCQLGGASAMVDVLECRVADWLNGHEVVDSQECECVGLLDDRRLVECVKCLLRSWGRQ